MVWPFTSPPSAQDASATLDADLQKFLKQETAQLKPQPDGKRQTKPNPPIPPRAPSQQFPRTGQTEQSSQTERQTSHSSTNDDLTPVPAQSLFQDGRYAHLWKNYRPISQVETLNEQEQFRALRDTLSARQTALRAAAEENCVVEAIAENECLESGGWGDKLWMCRDEARAHERCRNTQIKFLRALGYLGSPGRSAEEEERVQMHADGLYQQMLAHESALRKAKDDGGPAPEFKPVMSAENLARVLGLRIKEIEATLADAEAQEARVPDHVRKQMAAKLAKMSPEERAVESIERADRLREEQLLADFHRQSVENKKAQRLERFQEGTATMSDRVFSWWNGEK